MEARIKPLTLFGLLTVLVYQLIAWGYPLPDRAVGDRAWARSRLSIRFRGAEIIGLPTPSLRRVRLDFDRAARQIGHLGRLVRYGAREFQLDIFSAATTHGERLYPSSDLALQWAEDTARRSEYTLKALTAFVRRHLARGVQVVVLPVPTKLSLERDWLSKPPPSPYASLRAPVPPEDADGAYGLYVDAAVGSAVDLLEIYRRLLKQDPDLELFPAGGAHWNHLAQTWAARGIWNHLRRTGWDLPPADVESAGEVHQGFSDLASRILPSFLYRLRPDWSLRETLYQLRPRESVPPSSHRIAFAGTSFSTQYSEVGRSLPSQLRTALGAAVLSTPFDGSRTIASLVRLREQGVRLRPGDAVILELPVGSALWSWNEVPPDLFDEP